MKEHIKTLEKELSNAEFETLLRKMLKELSEDLNSIKNIQSEVKDTLIEIKNNLKGNNSRVDEVKNQMFFISKIWNITKKKTTNQNNEKKKEQKKMRVL